MSVILGNYAKPTPLHITNYAGGGYNQKGLLITAPADGRITRLGAWFGTITPPTMAARLCLWDYASGTLLAMSDVIQAPYVEVRVEADLTAPLVVSADQQLLVGWARDPNRDCAYAVGAEGSGTHYSRTRTSWPGSMSGMAAASYKMGAYAYFTEGGGAYVRRSGEWVPAEGVYVRRSGAWVPAEVKVRRSGAWVDPE